MKNSAIRSSLFLLSAFCLLTSGAPRPIDYQFERVRSKVVLSSPGGEVRAQTGTEAKNGDRVRTGWMGYAVLGAKRHAATFEIFSSSDVVLASDAPGAILSLERGRIKAIFDKISGDEPRAVKTPGALLAVRGTRYGVEVGRDGRATLAVFEGAVEVISRLRPQPLLVRAGEICEFGRAHAPMSMPMPHGMNEHNWNQHGMGGSMHDGGRSMDGSMGGHGSTGGHSGHGSSGRHH